MSRAAEAARDRAERVEVGEWELARRVWTWARPDAWAFGLALLLSPAAAALSLSQPWLVKRIIDEAVVPGRLDRLDRLALLYLGAVVGAYLVEAAYTLALAWGGQRTILRLREALYAHTLGLRQAFFDRQPAGKLLTRITSDVESLGESLAAGVVTIALDLLLIGGTLAAMFALDWRLTVLLLAGAPPLLWTVNRLRRRLRGLYLETREALAAVNAWLAERVDGVQIVQLFGAERASEEAFRERNARFNRAAKTANIHDAAMYAVVDGGSRIFVAWLLWAGAGLAGPALDRVGLGWLAPQAATIGLLVAFMDYLERLFRPIRELSGKVAVIQRAAAALSKILWLFEAGERAPAGGEAVDRVSGHLVVRDLRFRYREDGEDVLRGVDLEVRPGQVVAVVGATGSGKTTLTRLLDRSYEGYRGSIALDGRELSALEPRSLRRRVAAVRQDIQLFTETIAFNVDLGNPAIGPEERLEAARLVHALGPVERLGWDHVLRERGAELSVGEGQLLTFARAMAHDPDLVILDEATASVDSITEALIQDAIARILERKTVIVVAHRLSTVQAADRIVVMDAGRVVEQGTHEELARRDGRYAELLRAGAAVLR